MLDAARMRKMVLGLTKDVVGTLRPLRLCAFAVSIVFDILRVLCGLGVWWRRQQKQKSKRHYRRHHRG
jgi:hypothetical protein